MSLTNKMSDQRPVIAYEDDSDSNKLAKKSSEAPFFPIAIGVCTAAVIYGAYAYKKRGAMSTSVYLMQLRVAAQGLAIGTLTVGLAYTMIRDHVLNKDEPANTKH